MFSFFKKKKVDGPDLWNRFETWLSKNAPHLKAELNPSVAAQDLEELEKMIDSKLPQDYVDFLKIHNGQERDGEGLIDTEELLSSERIIEEWTVWKGLLDSGEFADYESKPDKGIKNDWWNSKWIPVTYDGNGNHYCLDLDPASDGSVGQIIRMWHDAAERELIAPSFKDWMDNYLTALNKGEYLYSEDWGGIVNKDDV